MNIMTRHFSEVCEALSLVDEDQIRTAVDIFRAVKEDGGTVWLAGNGGSAATAAHFANDLMKMGKVRAVAVSRMTEVTSAYGNDDGWSEMYARPLGDLIGHEDAVMGISTSGNSQNIVAFLAAAEPHYRIALTGPNENLLSRGNPDALIRAMADEITVIEDVHLIICHAMARMLR